jgi:hypothetical protein
MRIAMLTELKPRYSEVMHPLQARGFPNRAVLTIPSRY